MALDANTGKVVWDVQTSVDLKESYSITGAPRVVKGKVIIGNGGAELGARGFVSAYDAATGTTVCDALLAQEIEIEHACEFSCACSTCHVVIREGYKSLNEASELEDDNLDKAWGLSAQSRLSCQVKVAQADLTVEIPRYTINHAREEH